MEEKQEVMIISAIKAFATTSLLFGAAIKISEINELPTLPRLCTVLSIAIISWIGLWFYLTDLIKKGVVINTKKNHFKGFFQTFDIDWNTNLDSIGSAWLKSLGVFGIIVANTLILYVVSYAMIIAPIGGLAFLYMARKENKPVKYFAMGYACGVGSLLCGLLIAYLIMIFGPVLVWGFILCDAIISGIYTYMDLKEWEHDQNKKIQLAKELAEKEGML